MKKQSIALKENPFKVGDFVRCSNGVTKMRVTSIKGNDVSARYEGGYYKSRPTTKKFWGFEYWSEDDPQALLDLSSDSNPASKESSEPVKFKHGDIVETSDKTRFRYIGESLSWHPFSVVERGNVCVRVLTSNLSKFKAEKVVVAENIDTKINYTFIDTGEFEIGDLLEHTIRNGATVLLKVIYKSDSEREI